MTIRRFDTDLLPPAILSGPGARHALAAEAATLGLSRLLILCNASLRRDTHLVDDLAASLGTRCVAIHDRVVPNNPADSLTAVTEDARALGIDGIVSIGGGAAHDAAKAVAIAAPAGRPILDLVMRFEPPDTIRPPDMSAVVPLPVLAVPGTFAAAEVLSGGAVTDPARGEKLIFFHPGLAPRRVFLDGEVAATTPRPILAASGLNAVHHCLESLYAAGRHPVSDAFALAALAELVDVLPDLAPSAPPLGIGSFQRALDAASLSGLTYGNSGLGVGHAICHSLGGRFGLSHGAANAVIIRHSLRFNADAARPQLARAGRALGATGDDADAVRHLVARIDRLCTDLGTPARLRDIDLPPGRFDAIARDVLNDWLTRANPRPVSERDVIGILEAAW